MKKIKGIILTMVMAIAVLGAAVVPSTLVAAGDANPAADIGKGVSDIGGGTQDAKGLTEGIKTIINMMLFLLGAIAVIAIIIGGFIYVTSNGDSGKTKTAKDTIFYAVIGIVVAILAYAIVNFVISAFAKK